MLTAFVELRKMLREVERVEMMVAKLAGLVSLGREA